MKTYWLVILATIVTVFAGHECHAQFWSVTNRTYDGIRDTNSSPTVLGHAGQHCELGDIPDYRLPYGMMKRYFPETNIYSNRDTYADDWYSSTLRAMQEPSLYEATNQLDIVAYRVVVLFSGLDDATRITITTNGIFIRNVTTRCGDWTPHYIDFIRELATTNSLPSDISRTIETTIWNKEFKPQYKASEDGFTVFIEGVRSGTYRMIEMHCPYRYSKDREERRFVTLWNAIAGVTNIYGATMFKYNSLRGLPVRDPMR